MIGKAILVVWLVIILVAVISILKEDASDE